jgi:CRP/FNR family transcriptional regulator, cyclic AMP receptor protein
MRLKYLTDNDWALLRSIAHRREFKPREALIAIHSKASSLFVVTEGTVVVEVVRGKPVAKLTAGDICGEMAFLEHSGASASVIAETETQADVLDVVEVEKIFALYPHLQARFYRSLALLLSQRLRATTSELAKSAKS